MDTGGLMSYDAEVSAIYRRVATRADKILKGTRPAEHPVERLGKFDLVPKMKTGRKLSFKFPHVVLARANRVIE
jgi:putative tryptophan/tyrosine transport system substrate-binding protein